MNPYNQQLSPLSTEQMVVTVAIITHGTTSSVKLDTASTAAMENVRMYMISDKFGPAPAFVFSVLTNTHDHLKQEFQKDLPAGTTTRDILQKYVAHSTPKYKGLHNMLHEEPAADDRTFGAIHDHITFDKTFTSHEDSVYSDVMYNSDYMGIYVIAVHRKSPHDKSLELMYPLPHHDNKSINLLQVDHVRTMSKYMNDGIVIDAIPVDGVHFLPSPGTENDTIKSLVSQFVKNKHHNPYVRNDKIVFLRLTHLHTMLSTLFGADAQLNLLDYACSNINERSVTPEETRVYGKYVSPDGTDLEMGHKKFGGKRSGTKRKPRRKSKSRRKSRRKSKSKSKSKSRRKRR